METGLATTPTGTRTKPTPESSAFSTPKPLLRDCIRTLQQELTEMDDFSKNEIQALKDAESEALAQVTQLKRINMQKAGEMSALQEKCKSLQNLLNMSSNKNDSQKTVLALVQLLLDYRQRARHEVNGTDDATHSQNNNRNDCPDTDNAAVLRHILQCPHLGKMFEMIDTYVEDDHGHPERSNGVVDLPPLPSDLAGMCQATLDDLVPLALESAPDMAASRVTVQKDEVSEIASDLKNLSFVLAGQDAVDMTSEALAEQWLTSVTVGDCAAALAGNSVGSLLALAPSDVRLDEFLLMLMRRVDDLEQKLAEEVASAAAVAAAPMRKRNVAEVIEQLGDVHEQHHAEQLEQLRTELAQVVQKMFDDLAADKNVELPLPQLTMDTVRNVRCVCDVLVHFKRMLDDCNARMRNFNEALKTLTDYIERADDLHKLTNMAKLEDMDDKLGVFAKTLTDKLAEFNKVSENVTTQELLAKTKLIDQLNSELRNMQSIQKDEAARFKEECIALQHQIDIHRNEIEGYKAKLTKDKKKILELNSEVVSVTDKCKDLRMENIDKLSKIDLLKSEMLKLELKMSNLSKVNLIAFTEANWSSSASTSDCSKNEEELELLRESYKERSDEYFELKAMLTDQVDNNAELSSQILDVKRQLGEAIEKTETAAKEKNELVALVERLEDSKAQLQAMIEGDRILVASLPEMVAVRDKLEQANIESTATIEQLTSKNTALLEELTKLSLKCEADKTRYKDLHMERDMLADQIRNLESQMLEIKSAHEMIVDLQSHHSIRGELQLVKQKLNEAISAREDMNAKNGELVLKIQQFKLRITALEEEQLVLCSNINRNDTIRDQLDDVKRNHDELLAKNATQQTLIDKMSDDFAQLNSKLIEANSIRETLAEVSKELDHSKIQLLQRSSLNAELEVLEQKLSEAVNERDKCTMNNVELRIKSSAQIEEILALKTSISDNECSSAETAKNNSMLTQQNCEFKAQIKSLEAQICKVTEQEHSSRALLSDENSAFKDKLEAVIRERDDLYSKQEQRVQVVARQEERIDSLMKEVKNHMVNISLKEALLSKERSTVAHLDQMILSQKIDIADLQDIIAVQQTQTESSAQYAKNEIESAQSRIKILDKEMCRLVLDLEIVRNQLSEVTAISQSFRAERDESRAQLKEMTNAKSEEMQELKQSFAKVQNDYDNLRKEKQAQAAIQERREMQQVQSIKVELTRAQKECENLRRENAKHMEDGFKIMGHVSKIASLEAKNKNYKAELEKSAEKITQLSADAKKHHEEILTFKKKSTELQNMLRKFDDFKALAVKHQGTISSLEAKVLELTFSISEKEKTIATLNGIKANLQQKLKEADSQLEKVAEQDQHRSEDLFKHRELVAAFEGQLGNIGEDVGRIQEAVRTAVRDCGGSDSLMKCDAARGDVAWMLAVLGASCAELSRIAIDLSNRQLPREGSQTITDKAGKENKQLTSGYQVVGGAFPCQGQCQHKQVAELQASVKDKAQIVETLRVRLAELQTQQCISPSLTSPPSSEASVPTSGATVAVFGVLGGTAAGEVTTMSQVSSLQAQVQRLRCEMQLKQLEYKRMVGEAAEANRHAAQLQGRVENLTLRLANAEAHLRECDDEQVRDYKRKKLMEVRRRSIGGRNGELPGRRGLHESLLDDETAAHGSFMLKMPGKDAAVQVDDVRIEQYQALKQKLRSQAALAKRKEADRHKPTS